MAHLLWYYQQLLTHANEMLEKEREIRVLCDRLHKAEMELAALKLERLSARTHPSVSHSTTTNLIGPTAEGTGLNPSSLGEHNKPLVTSLAERSEGLVTTRQPNAAAAATTDIQSMLLNDPRVIPSFQSAQEQQVTSTNTSLSGALFTTTPVSSEAVSTGLFTATAAAWGRDQSQCCHGKAPPIDEFTGEDR